MNRLNTGNTGGMPFNTDYFDFLSDNDAYQATAIVKAFANGVEAVILSGCEISVSGEGGASPVLNITEGAVWYSDEIYKVETQTTALSSGTTLAYVLANWKWDLVETTDVNVVYKNGSVNPAYKYRKAALVANPTTWTTGVAASIPTLKARIEYPYADYLTEGVVRLSSQSELANGTTDTAITAKDLGDSGITFEIQPADANVTVSTSAYKAKYRKYGNVINTSVRFRFIAATTTNYMKFTTSIATPFSDIDFTAIPAGFRLASGVVSEIPLLVMESTSDYSFRIYKADLSDFTVGESYVVAYNGTLLK